MLLLISPPGYGKTTLMEYVAHCLGLVLVKINCPALGHQVRSLDPAAAPHATARQEVERLNLALAMGNNVLCYLDDIQHTHPEFLQQFISLADAQRRMEGVWDGRPRTYDLRGKRFCLVMAGNPYTESGAVFSLPDMLANRADIYNLGDILQGQEEIFALSYLENALPSNPVLAPLAHRDLEDFYRFVRMASGAPLASAELTHPYSAHERQEIVAVLQKLQAIQEVVLAVNRQYIASASQEDAYRTEPPFRLQGSYRNMNKMAERVVAVMNDEELARLIDDHYRSEAQTLAAGAEENLLKLGELRGTLSEPEARRWEEIKQGYQRLSAGGSKETDPATRIVGQLVGIGQQLAGIQQRIGAAANQGLQTRQAHAEALQQWLQGTRESLEKLHLHVQVVNQPVPELSVLLTQLVHAYDQTLLPLLRALHHKMSLDESIWRQVTEVHKILKTFDWATLAEGTQVDRRLYPLGEAGGQNRGQES
jgi:MoxR-like ATPase